MNKRLLWCPNFGQGSGNKIQISLMQFWSFILSINSNVLPSKIFTLLILKSCNFFDKLILPSLNLSLEIIKEFFFLSARNKVLSPYPEPISSIIWLLELISLFISILYLSNNLRLWFFIFFFFLLFYHTLYIHLNFYSIQDSGIITYSWSLFSISFNTSLRNFFKRVNTIFSL